ncbi:hypothetical protein AB0E69_22945 [Kribbella sp. NPDC026611]|uniref:hypothetical protein n=1 Tax=Kribbella sp. NPDC026611 TaxID=3154911 RepID=UPI0033F3CC2B
MPEASSTRRRQWLVFGLLVAGVLLALINTNAQTELTRRRQATCDGTLPLPTTAYLVGFAGLLIGAIALFLLVRWFRHSRQPIATTLLITAATAVIFEVFALATAFHDAKPIDSLCFG